MKKMLFLLFTICFAGQSHATDLMDIYQQALENDPTFKEAYSNYMSTSESIPIARSALYPQLGVNAQVSRNVIETKTASINFEQTYNSNQWQINASQAVFNFQAWALVQQAKATVKAAQATFNDAAQDLMLRTARAYFDVLLARDTLSFAEAKRRANRRQLEQAEERFRVGLDAITSVYEARSAYDQSVAQVITARNNLENQSENLRKLTNHIYAYLVPLRNSRIPLIRPEPNDINEWVDVGLKQNYNLYAAKYSLQAARENIRVQAANGWPTLGIQANSSQTHNDVHGGGGASFFAPSKQTNSSIALALNFPVFQGGLVVAQTRQAQFDFQAASERLERVYRNVVVNSRIAFNTIIDGISKVQADRQTVISQQNTLQSTEAQFQVGTRTMVDVVNAQQRLFEAQRQLAEDQYNLIIATLNLKYLAGTLNVNDLEEVNSWLATTRVSRFPPPLPRKGKLESKHTVKKIIHVKLKGTKKQRTKKQGTKKLKSYICPINDLLSNNASAP
ncbi:TolC family outer membrane protein [Legionella gresilensis]|uniref:TolC family outer membrane protein n=1 Tax=Legionella gresilensis TaxID=91823 RepID=UPI001040F6C0|nr:TolC family outer membrane protein [Legionella gresilensis]